jgi:cytochrome c peroxidase
MPVIRYETVRNRVGLVPLGVLWVRVPPLVAVSATAPYLHNGSVPTLRDLLSRAGERPVSFPVGRNGFVLDTRLPGNRNIGHEFGANLTSAEKDDLVAFLMSL